ncbi:cyclin-like protein [Gigaspora margarita]|uniref:Cyclin-like protein n=1 Tax=Gigaspora margarita TaxID=4874 RepID=A0A8H4AZI7_GIGMA|nr:cyclin-like protein [Gigaspora margarita]
MENNIKYTTEPGHLTAYEFHYNSPSRRDNITYIQEIFQRAKGVQFMERLRTNPSISLDSYTYALAAHYFHIFYMHKSLKEFNCFDVGASCLFLAAKITDNRRDLNLISDFSARISLKQMQNISSDHEINKWKHKILKYEPSIFFLIYPYMDIKLPFQFLFMFRDSLTGYDQEIVNRLIGCSFQLLMDCMFAPIMLFFNPITISAAAIFLAAKFSDIPLNDDPRAGACWFELAKVEDINIIAAAVDYILQSYPTGPVIKKLGCTQDPNCTSNPLHFGCTEIEYVGRAQIPTPPDT